MNKVPGIALRAVLLLAAALVPSMLPDGMPARPDLVLPVVVVAALVHGSRTGALVGLAGGWLLDLVPPGGSPLGAAALTYLAVGLLAGQLRRWASWSPLLPLVATVVGGVVVQVVRGVTAAAGVGVAHPVDLLWALAITLLCSVVLLPPLLALERGLVERRWA